MQLSTCYSSYIVSGSNYANYFLKLGSLLVILLGSMVEHHWVKVIAWVSGKWHVLTDREQKTFEPVVK